MNFAAQPKYLKPFLFPFSLQAAAMSKRNRTNDRSDSAKKSKTVAAKSAQSHQLRISDLNDDCLASIFSYLNPNELCAVKETSSCFASMADLQFKRKYGNKEFVFLPKFEKKLPRNVQAHVVSPEFWPLFGEFIEKLSIHANNGADAAQHWKSICENCTRLEDLSVFTCDLKLFQPADFSVQRHQLNSLHLACFFGRDDDYTRIINYFADFERLSVRYIHNNSVRCEFLRHNYPRLKEIAFESIEANEHFDEFVRLNPQIEKVFFKACSLDYDRLDIIAQHCPKIETISVQCDPASENYADKIARLARLAALKELQFKCFDDFQGPLTAAIKVLAKKNSLQVLGLTGGRLDMDLCRALCKMTNLRTLKLVEFENVRVNLLKKLVSGLKLKHLHVMLGDVKFKDIVVAVKSSPTLESLTLMFCEEFILDNTRFSQLVSARLASGAGIPLELYHSQEDTVTVDKQQLQKNAQLIKLKKHYGLLGYITNEY